MTNVNKSWQSVVLDSTTPVMLRLKKIEAAIRRIPIPPIHDEGSDLLKEWRKKSKVKFMKRNNGQTKKTQ